MKSVKKFSMSFILIFTMLIGCISVNPVFANENFVYGGWFETVYAQWNDTNPNEATVQYKKSGTSEYLTVDSELIRNYDGTGRVDILGLEAGEYDIKITAGNGNVFTKENIPVKPHDRTGYAHKNYPQGVGAYKNDGTPKDNALIIYVTNENKNSITVPGYESYGTGIGWLLNGNRSFVEKLVADNRPLIVRFVGKIEPPEGLTVYDSYENGGTPGDNGNMCIIKSSKNVTLEGVGYDAIIEGWGFSIFVGDGYTNYESYEVRNLSFQKYPEDALGFQGYMENNAIKNPIEHVWVHNNSFDTGYCANPTESDKHEGDGSCDFKRGQYYTMDYNYYQNCHKTNLVGASDTNLQFNMTFHHNYYVNCASRGPLARQANIHLYNTYFKGNTSKTVDARANSFIFSEGNFYDTCKNPITVKSGAVVKSYNDVFYNTSEDQLGTVVSDKSQTINSACKYANFDTADDFYEYNATSAVQAKADCIAFSGVMKKPEEIIENPTPESVIPVEPENAVSLPYSVTFDNTSASDYFGSKLASLNIKQLDPGVETTIDNIIYKAGGKYSQTATAFKFKEQGAVFKIDKKCVVGIKSSGGSYPVVVYNSDGIIVLSVQNSTKYAVLEPGTYMLQSGLAEKEAYLCALSIKEYTDESSIPEDETQSTTEKTTESTTEGNTDSDDEGNDDIVDTDPNKHILDFTNNINSASFFEVNGKYKTDKTINYNNKTYTKSLNMESSTTIRFITKKKAELSIVALSNNSSPGIKIDGKKNSILAKGENIFELEPGEHTITKDTSSTYIFMATVTEDDFEYSGDINGDGSVGLEDAVLLMKYILDKGSNPLSPTQLKAAKITKDNNTVTATNVAYIIEYALNKDIVNK